jgi:hypothetical protein
MPQMPHTCYPPIAASTTRTILRLSIVQTPERSLRVWGSVLAGLTKQYDESPQEHPIVALDRTWRREPTDLLECLSADPGDCFSSAVTIRSDSERPQASE